MSDQRDYREPLSDEEAAEMERGLRRLLHTPPKPHGKNPTAHPPKRKKRPVKPGLVYKGKTST